MSEYIVDFGDKSSAFVGLAMAETELHGATLRGEIVRCKDCLHYEKADYIESDYDFCGFHDYIVEPDSFCSWGRVMDEC